MKNPIAVIVRAGLIISALAFVSIPASAAELWDPHLRGVDEGMASGALPPPGVYGVLNNYWLTFDQYDSAGQKTGVKLDIDVEVPIVLWQTGVKILGADYAVAVAQPFDYTNVKVPGVAALSANGHWGTYNTILVPAILSWSLASDIHVSTGLTVYLDDASSSPAHPPAGGGVGSGNGYWTVQPDLAVSWLHDGWNASVSMHYDYNLQDSETLYKTGQILAVDYTLAKTLGKWTLGVGGFLQNQLTDDTGAGAQAHDCASQSGCRISIYGVGPLVGYQFGGLEILGEYNFNLNASNDVGGSMLNVRLVAPL